MAPGNEYLETTGDWHEHKRHVLSEIGRQGNAIDKLDKAVDDLARALTDFRLAQTEANANMKFRQTIVGTIAALAPAAMGALLWYLSHQGG